MKRERSKPIRREVYPKMTKRQTIIRGLLAAGMTEVECRSGFYSAFKGPRGWYYVGRAGALRFNPKKNSASDSISLGDSGTHHYIRLGEEKHEKGEI